MRFLVDASSDARLVDHLRSLGHDVTRIGTDYPARLRDVDVLETAHREQRILITDDRDFGELIFRQHHPHVGVIYLRLETTVFAVRRDRVDRVLASHAGQLDHFLVVTERNVRVRIG
ncbi:MAG: DUF5615 family PIN-like protein [Chloroflexi bacterium]|nr:DUF5615 family PIN-like protein [Chloroflexota bacterium]